MSVFCHQCRSISSDWHTCQFAMDSCYQDLILEEKYPFDWVVYSYLQSLNLALFLIMFVSVVTILPYNYQQAHGYFEWKRNSDSKVFFSVIQITAFYKTLSWWLILICRTKVKYWSIFFLSYPFYVIQIKLNFKQRLWLSPVTHISSLSPDSYKKVSDTLPHGTELYSKAIVCCHVPACMWY